MICLLSILTSCGSSNSTDTTDPDPAGDLPTIVINDVRAIELEDDTAIKNFEVRLTAASTSDISFNYVLSGITAEPDIDFVTESSSIVIAAGETSVSIPVSILPDNKREIEEQFSLTISEVDNAKLDDDSAVCTIIDQDDESLSTDEDGYISEQSFFGYNLLWSDEFEDDELNDKYYNYDIGNGCPNLCGWGNNELELYTDLPKNSKLSNSNLVITATKNFNTFESAKIHTKDKLEFQFGRIDIRAKLPEGQGIWPAIWMLGANIDEVGWPACGEIDIMEMVGHEANKTHGTAHWGMQGQASTFKGSSYSIGEKFIEEFHVFTLVWEFNKLTWYVDENKFFTLTPSDIGNASWRFNAEFYLILNVAVGGNWPGYPDNTTVFPQSMEIDYVRVFQRN